MSADRLLRLHDILSLVNIRDGHDRFEVVKSGLWHFLGALLVQGLSLDEIK